MIFNRLIDSLPLLPFPHLSAWAITRNLHKDAHTILDVDCGEGNYTKLINRDGVFRTVGVDLFRQYVEKAVRKRPHSGYILCDGRFLPFLNKGFDVVIAVQVFEHLEKHEALKLIKNMEDVGLKKIIIITPVGFLPHGIIEENPFHVHKSSWGADEFVKKGYRVRAPGLRVVQADQGLSSRLPSFETVTLLYLISPGAKRRLEVSTVIFLYLVIFM